MKTMQCPCCRKIFAFDSKNSGQNAAGNVKNTGIKENAKKIADTENIKNNEDAKTVEYDKNTEYIKDDDIKNKANAKTTGFIQKNVAFEVSDRSENLRGTEKFDQSEKFDSSENKETFCAADSISGALVCPFCGASFFISDQNDLTVGKDTSQKNNFSKENEQENLDFAVIDPFADENGLLSDLPNCFSSNRNCLNDQNSNCSLNDNRSQESVSDVSSLFGSLSETSSSAFSSPSKYISPKNIIEPPTSPPVLDSSEFFSPSVSPPVLDSSESFSPPVSPPVFLDSLGGLEDLKQSENLKNVVPPPFLPIQSVEDLGQILNPNSSALSVSADSVDRERSSLENGFPKNDLFESENASVKDTALESIIPEKAIFENTVSDNIIQNDIVPENKYSDNKDSKNIDTENLLVPPVLSDTVFFEDSAEKFDHPVSETSFPQVSFSFLKERDDLASKNSLTELDDDKNEPPVFVDRSASRTEFAPVVPDVLPDLNFPDVSAVPTSDIPIVAPPTLTVQDGNIISEIKTNESSKKYPSANEEPKTNGNLNANLVSNGDSAPNERRKTAFVLTRTQKIGAVCLGGLLLLFLFFFSFKGLFLSNEEVAQKDAQKSSEETINKNISSDELLFVDADQSDVSAGRIDENMSLESLRKGEQADSGSSSEGIDLTQAVPDVLTEDNLTEEDGLLSPLNGSELSNPPSTLSEESESSESISNNSQEDNLLSSAEISPVEGEEDLSDDGNLLSAISDNESGRPENVDSKNDHLTEDQADSKQPDFQPSDPNSDSETDSEADPESEMIDMSSETTTDPTHLNLPVLQKPHSIDLVPRLKIPVSGLALKETPLIDALRAVSDYAGLPFQIDSETLKMQLIALEQPMREQFFETNIENIFNDLAQKTQFHWEQEKTSIDWKPGVDLIGFPQEKIYQIDDLISQPLNVSWLEFFEQILNSDVFFENGSSVLENVPEKTLEKDSENTIENISGEKTFFKLDNATGRLTVRASLKVHFELECFLNAIRTAREIPIRFSETKLSFSDVKISDQEKEIWKTTENWILNAEKIPDAESQCWKKLSQQMTLNTLEPLSLQRILQLIEQNQKIRIFIDEKALFESGISLESKVQIHRNEGTVAQALDDLLSGVKLSYRIVGSSAIEISSEEKIKQYSTIELHSCLPENSSKTVAAFLTSVFPQIWSDSTEKRYQTLLISSEEMENETESEVSDSSALKKGELFIDPVSGTIIVVHHPLIQLEIRKWMSSRPLQTNDTAVLK